MTDPRVPSDLLKQYAGDLSQVPVNDCAAIARELLELRAQLAQSEPVAWMRKLDWEGEEDWQFCEASELTDKSGWTPLYAAPPCAEHDRLAQCRPSDEEILSRIINECDTLDITRVSELKNGEWHATTIFDGDTALLRTFKDAMLPAVPESKETHTDHPARHWDRTCPACNPAPESKGRKS